MALQNVAPGSTKFCDKIHQHMVKVMRGHNLYAVGVVIASRPTFCYVITDKCIFEKPRSKPFRVIFPQGSSQEVQQSDVRFGDQLAAFYVEKPDNAPIPDAVILSEQTILRNQTYYLFDYTRINRMYSGICGGNVNSIGEDTFEFDATGHFLGGPVIDDECQLVGISTRVNCSLALRAEAIRTELIDILHEEDSSVEFNWTMDDVVEHIVNTHVP